MGQRGESIFEDNAGIWLLVSADGLKSTPCPRAASPLDQFADKIGGITDGVEIERHANRVRREQVQLYANNSTMLPKRETATLMQMLVGKNQSARLVAWLELTISALAVGSY